MTLKTNFTLPTHINTEQFVHKESIKNNIFQTGLKILTGERDEEEEKKKTQTENKILIIQRK